MKAQSNATTLLDKIKADLKDDPYYKQHFSNDGQRFLAWYLRNCYLRTPVQAKDDITDGPNDKEFDAIIVDDEKRQIIVIQGKFYEGTVDHQPLQEVLAAWLQIHHLDILQDNCNQKLKIKLEAVATALEEDYEVVFELLTTGRLTPEAQNDWTAFQSNVAEFEQIDASLSLVDAQVIETRRMEALGKELPKITHSISLEPGCYMYANIANFKTVIATIALADCVKFPGIRDGKLFRPNVRQSLGLTNKVNKEMKRTLNGDDPQFFFFYHNGLTALCEKLDLDQSTHELKLHGLGVVNGCQSLNTIVSCSEKIKARRDARVLVRFYEIPQRDFADNISVFTNSQSAVKPRDLRSNDKRVLAIKRAYEGAFPQGYLLTKRGDKIPADKNTDQVIDIVLLARCLMAWHCQRPTISSNENRLFDKHFELLFRADYSPADIAGLNHWARKIENRWALGDISLNEDLLAVPSFSKFHLLYAIQFLFAAASNQSDKVPLPSATIHVPNSDVLITAAANSFNSAFDAGKHEYEERGKLFNPQNWLKAKDSILKLQSAVRMALTFMNSGESAEMKKALVLAPEQFSLRWDADRT